jgi:hypothetical protein
MNDPDPTDRAETLRFLDMVRARLDAGAEEYGDQSFARPCDALLAELEEELLDVAGWASILFARAHRLRRAAIVSSDAPDRGVPPGDGAAPLA